MGMGEWVRDGTAAEPGAGARDSRQQPRLGTCREGFSQEKGNECGDSGCSISPRDFLTSSVPSAPPERSERRFYSLETRC